MHVKKWFAVIGDPIAHSKSPDMHSIWYDELNINASYIPIHVEKESLHHAVESMKLLGISGFNVTIPHKEEIIPYLDELDRTAQKMGAVNTVVRTSDGRFKGYNTDGVGFVKSLHAAVGKSLLEEQVLIIGAGGAARGIAFALDDAGYSNISIANRTVAKAGQIAQNISGGKALSLQQAEQMLERYKIIIQTTPAGMSSSDFELPFSLNRMAADTIACDIVYNPLMTPFLQFAEKKGAKVVTGLGMFIHQGATAFEHWLGIYPPIERVESFLLEQLQTR